SWRRPAQYRLLRSCLIRSKRGWSPAWPDPVAILLASPSMPESRFGGSGCRCLNFVYIEDVARANILALKSDRGDDVYNVAGGTETSLLGLWEALQRVTGAYHLAPEFHPPRKVNPVPRRLADIARAKRELGFTAEVPLDEGLRRLAAWRDQTLSRQEALAR